MSTGKKMKPHKHAELIKAWADGAQIEYWDFNGMWVEVANPCWEMEMYRIKPEPKPWVKFIQQSMILELELILEKDGPLMRIVDAKVRK